MASAESLETQDEGTWHRREPAALPQVNCVNERTLPSDNGLKNAIVLGLPFAFTFVSLNQAYNCRFFFPVYFRCPRIDGVYQPETEGIFQPAPSRRDH